MKTWVLLTAFVFALAWQGAAAGSPPPDAQAAQAAKPKEPETVAVEFRRAAGTLRLAGELRPWQEVELHARLPAYVQERRVDVGDRVAQDQVLVVLSAPDRVAERAQAEAENATAQARLRRLETAARREGVVAPVELEDARGAAAASAAKARALKELEAELTVRAPFAGVVTARGVDAGALVGHGAGAALVSVADLSRLRLVVAVPERNARVARPGVRIAFREEGLDPERPRSAVVSRTSGRLDEGTRTLPVEMDVDNSDGALVAGSYVEVLWPLDDGETRPWVPATAVVRSSEGTWVWVRRGNALVKVVVEELQLEAGFSAVRAALVEGDLVVRRGSEDFAEGPWPGSAR
ncbi:MAG: efflux RND transporter periplasmic adaptor subunit [Candidatus Binatia bacterium]